VNILGYLQSPTSRVPRLSQPPAFRWQVVAGDQTHGAQGNGFLARLWMGIIHPGFLLVLGAGDTNLKQLGAIVHACQRGRLSGLSEESLLWGTQATQGVLNPSHALPSSRRWGFWKDLVLLVRRLPLGFTNHEACLISFSSWQLAVRVVCR
jgi:hypothetical protein